MLGRSVTFRPESIEKHSQRGTLKNLTTPSKHFPMCCDLPRRQKMQELLKILLRFFEEGIRRMPYVDGYKLLVQQRVLLGRLIHSSS